MSSSNHSFTLGGLDQAFPRPAATASVVTAAPFAIAPEPASAPNTFQPMVFRPFDGYGKIVTVHGPETPVVEEIVEEIDVVVAEELPPPPPPPDYEAIKAEA